MLPSFSPGNGGETGDRRPVDSRCRNFSDSVLNTRILMQFFHDTHIDFVGKRKFWYIVSIVITVAGLIVAFTKGVQFGIDFEGGTEASFKFPKPVESDQVRGAVDAAGFQGAEIKSIGTGNDEVLIRVAQPADTKVITGESTKISDQLKTALEQRFKDNPPELRRVDNIGPKIGKELRLQAL